MLAGLVFGNNIHINQQNLFLQFFYSVYLYELLKIHEHLYHVKPHFEFLVKKLHENQVGDAVTALKRINARKQDNHKEPLIKTQETKKTSYGKKRVEEGTDWSKKKNFSSLGFSLLAKKRTF